MQNSCNTCKSVTSDYCKRDGHIAIFLEVLQKASVVSGPFVLVKHTATLFYMFLKKILFATFFIQELQKVIHTTTLMQKVLQYVLFKTHHATLSI